MPVSASQLREVRSALDDINRLLEGDPEYDPFVEALSGAREALDEMTDERGQMREQEGPKLGARVKQPEDDDEDMGPAADPAAGLVPPEKKRPKNFGGPRR